MLPVSKHTCPEKHKHLMETHTYVRWHPSADVWQLTLFISTRLSSTKANAIIQPLHIIFLSFSIAFYPSASFVRVFNSAEPVVVTNKQETVENREKDPQLCSLRFSVSQQLGHTFYITA